MTNFHTQFLKVTAAKADVAQRGVDAQVVSLTHAAIDVMTAGLDDPKVSLNVQHSDSHLVVICNVMKKQGQYWPGEEPKEQPKEQPKA